MAPDLRKFDSECMGLADPEKQSACFMEMDDFYVATVRRGRARDGRVDMPPFEAALSQEAIWSIRIYLETRRQGLDVALAEALRPGVCGGLVFRGESRRGQKMDFF